MKSNLNNSASRHRGHKRSSLVHVSVQAHSSKAKSTRNKAEMRFSPVKLNWQDRTKSDPESKQSSAHALASPTPQSRHNSQPPTSATFDPTPFSLIAGTKPPSFTPAEQLPSPTLAVSNYYADNSGSEEEFFQPKKTSVTKETQGGWLTHPEHHELFSSPSMEAHGAARRHGRSQSVASSLLPTGPRHPSFIPHTPQPASPTRAAKTASLVIPGHLTGPRMPPSRPASKRTSATSLSTDKTKSSLHHSIFMLRRMNSDVSCVSTEDGDDIGTLPTSSSRSSLNSPRRRSRNFNLERLRENKEERGSKAYLSLGLDDARKFRHEKRRSIIAIQEKRMTVDKISEGVEQAEVVQSGNPNVTPQKLAPGPGVYKTFTPVSVLMKKRSNDSPTRQKSVRWSDATPLAAPSTTAKRDESPTRPFASSRYRPTLSSERKDKKPRIDKETLDTIDDYGDWNGHHGSPDSLGLYDTHGFLKMSPPKTKEMF